MPDQPIITPSMYCKKCAYPLVGLDRQRCPECGRPFDPDDPRTYRAKLRMSRAKLVGIIAAIGVVLVPHVMCFWHVYFLFAAIPSAPIIYLGRHRAKWHWAEVLVFFAPFWTWVALMFTDMRPKSLANLIELLYVAVGVPVAALIRVILGRREPLWLYSGVLIALLCALAVILYLTTPALPE